MRNRHPTGQRRVRELHVTAFSRDLARAVDDKGGNNVTAVHCVYLYTHIFTNQRMIRVSCAERRPASGLAAISSGRFYRAGVNFAAQRIEIAR